MWIASVLGFYSIVQSRHDERVWMVRSRHAEDIENLKQATGLFRKTIRSEDTDYPFRILINQDDLYRVMGTLAASVKYPNFKSAVELRPNQRNKVSAYHRIWGILLDTQVVRSAFNAIRPAAGRLGRLHVPDLYERRQSAHHKGRDGGDDEQMAGEFDPLPDDEDDVFWPLAPTAKDEGGAGDDRANPPE